MECVVGITPHAGQWQVPSTVPIMVSCAVLSNFLFGYNNGVYNEGIIVMTRYCFVYSVP